MTEKPVIVKPNTSISECARIMSEKHVGSLLISENNKILGLITEQDIVRKVVGRDLDIKKEKVENFMEKRLITIAPEVDIFDAINMMSEYNIRHLPVMSDNKMIGFVTLKDILKIEPELFELLVDKFELRETERKPI